MKRTSPWRFVPALLILIPYGTAHAINGTPTWFQSVVAAPSPSKQITAPSLAFDHYGTPSVSWSDVTNSGGSNTIFRSTTNGLGFWSQHTVAAGADVGILTALSFDRAERPTVAWIDRNGAVSTQFDDAINQTLSPMAGNAPPAMSISHDLTGTLRGAFASTAAGTVYDINGAVGSHASASIGTFANVSNILDLRLTTDHSGRRHVIARVSLTTNNQGVLVASEPVDGGAWASTLLATADSVGGVAIATSPVDGKIALAYTTLAAGTNLSKLVYAKSTGTILQSTDVQSSNTAIFEDIDLAFDLSDGRPAIAYERKMLAPFAQEIRFAYENASSVWQTSLIDGTASLDNPFGLPRRPSLAFDDYGTSWPAVAYTDANGSLNVAFDPPAPEPATALLAALVAPVLLRRRRNSATA
ncbi:MAG TPA: hypothetical protein VNT79_19050 [Phycisphaerae bacterium]|nr:hypothetical protein [Phycisphaerae bacterium]